MKLYIHSYIHYIYSYVTHITHIKKKYKMQTNFFTKRFLFFIAHYSHKGLKK